MQTAVTSKINDLPPEEKSILREFASEYRRGKAYIVSQLSRPRTILGIPFGQKWSKAEDLGLEGYYLPDRNLLLEIDTNDGTMSLMELAKVKKPNRVVVFSDPVRVWGWDITEEFKSKLHSK